MKSKYNKIIFSWVLVVLWYLVIWYFSSANGDSSQAMSSGVIEWLDSILPVSINDTDNIQFIVRKAAHMTEYAILFTLVFHACKVTFPTIYYPSFALTLGLACIDEFHQLYVVGREGQYTDVAIDMIGVAIAALIIYLIRRQKAKREIL